MEEVLINNWSELLNHFASQEAGIYRGVSHSTYVLKPKIGRESPTFAKNMEENFLQMFRDYALPYIKNMPTNLWEWLALAQHYGLATRLLDWTRNPLTATFFAVEKEIESDSAIYFIRMRGFFQSIDLQKYPNPFAMEEVSVYLPPHVSSRIIVQSGLFTIHPNPFMAYDNDKMIKFIIPASQRFIIKEHLHDYGITDNSLFPDLEGVSNHINFIMARMRNKINSSPK